MTLRGGQNAINIAKTTHFDLALVLGMYYDLEKVNVIEISHVFV